MIVTKIKVDGRRVKLGGYGFRKYQMFQLGRFAEKTIEERVARGVGSNDSPMPALNKDRKRKLKSGEIRVYSGFGYQFRKVKRGGNPLRDLRLTGQMLQDFGVKYADADKVRLDVTTRRGRIKARANERRAAWYGFSRFDEEAIKREAMRIFRGNINNVARVQRGASGRSLQWDDPRSLSGLRVVAA